MKNMFSCMKKQCVIKFHEKHVFMNEKTMCDILNNKNKILLRLNIGILKSMKAIFKNIEAKIR